MDIPELISGRRLRCFLVLSEELHFGRAAVRLGITQPRLSREIKALELALGFALFARTSRQVSLLKAGAALAQNARAGIAELDHGIREARLINAGEAGSLTIGYVATAMLGFLPFLIRQYATRYPQVRIRLHEVSSAPQFKRLRNHQLDIAIVTEPRPMSDIRIDREWEEVLMAVAPVVDTDESIRSIALSVLAARPFVLFERRLAPPLYDKIFELCLAAGFTPRIAQETQSWQAALGLVAAGYGVSVMPASLGRLEFPGVRFRPLRDSPTITYGACVRPNDQRATVRNFVTMLGPQVANLSRGMLPRKPR